MSTSTKGVVSFPVKEKRYDPFTGAERFVETGMAQDFRAGKPVGEPYKVPQAIGQEHSRPQAVGPGFINYMMPGLSEDARSALRQEMTVKANAAVVRGNSVTLSGDYPSGDGSRPGR